MDGPRPPSAPGPAWGQPTSTAASPSIGAPASRPRVRPRRVPTSGQPTSPDGDTLEVDADRPRLGTAVWCGSTPTAPGGGRGVMRGPPRPTKISAFQTDPYPSTHPPSPLRGPLYGGSEGEEGTGRSQAEGEPAEVCTGQQSSSAHPSHCSSFPSERPRPREAVWVKSATRQLAPLQCLAPLSQTS